MIQKCYETDRLLLKLSESSLAGQVKDFYLRNQDFLRDTEPLREKTFYTDEFQRRALTRDYRNARGLAAVKYWLQLKENDEKGDVIGLVSLANIVFGPFRSAFVTYKMDGEYTGRGLMGEALQQLVSIAFDDIELHRLEANVMPRNKPSLRLVEKLGFQNEGTAKKYLRINGVWEDHIHMVLLNEAVE